MLGGSYGSLFYDLVHEKTAFLVTLTSEMLCALLCAPLLFGYCSLCIRLVRGENCPLSEMFSPYSSLRNLKSVYGFLLKILPALLLKLVLPLAALTFVYSFLGRAAESYSSSEIGMLLLALSKIYFVPAAMVLFGCICLLGKNIRSLFVFCSGTDADAEISKRSFSFLRLRISLYPLHLLSFLTFGILFIVFTIPYTVISYSLYFGFDEYNQNEDEITEENSEEIVIPPEVSEQTYETNGDTAIFDINKNTEIN